MLSRLLIPRNCVMLPLTGCFNCTSLPFRGSSNSSSSSTTAHCYRHVAAAHRRLQNDQGSISTSTSTSSSEQVTRTLLGSASTLMHAGIAPTGVCAFASAVGDGAASTSNAGDSASSTDELHSSFRVTFSAISGDSAELLSDYLLGMGAQSVVIEEAQLPGRPEQERFGAEAELWDRCQVKAHFDLQHDVAGTVAGAKDVLELPDLTFQQEQVVDQEWVSQIKASYVPMQVCEGLYIVPDWHDGGGEESSAEPGAISIRLTPGVAFGTGEHPTTKLCLKELLSLLPSMQGCTMMDYGAGSGVLAIAGLLLGASSAVATDIDPLAVRAAAANAVLNNVQQQMQVLQCGPNLSDPDPVLQLPDAGIRQFDLVVANILRGPLLELQPRLTGYCKPGGRLVLSGILTEQAPDVIAGYCSSFDQFHVSSEGSWAVVTAVRQTDSGTC